MEIELTDAAICDLRSIRDYTFGRWGDEQEERYLNERWKRFKELLSDPMQSRARDDLFPSCRLGSQGKHVSLFRRILSEKKERLQAVRVLHSAMDFKRHVP